MAEEKIKSKTELFKERLQAKAEEVLGKRISKQDAWKLFKEFIKAPFEAMVETYRDAGKPTIEYGKRCDELTLSLSGVGAFKVIPVGGADNLSVKPRFYISSSIENAVKVALGFAAEEATEETEAVAAEADAEDATGEPSTKAEEDILADL